MVSAVVENYDLLVIFCLDIDNFWTQDLGMHITI